MAHQVLTLTGIEHRGAKDRRERLVCHIRGGGLLAVWGDGRDKTISTKCSRQDSPALSSVTPLHPVSTNGTTSVIPTGCRRHIVWKCAAAADRSQTAGPDFRPAASDDCDPCSGWQLDSGACRIGPVERVRRWHPTTASSHVLRPPDHRGPGVAALTKT
jgi:hypothetical protein